MSRHRGFTLIEALVVVAIVGILASVGLPVLRAAMFRARLTERGTMVTAINQAVKDYWVRHNRFPAGTESSSLMSLPGNPGFPLTTVKRPMLPALGDWGLLSLNAEGGVYFSYSGLMNAGDAIAGGPGRRRHVVWADGDLDGQGSQPTTMSVWSYNHDALTSHSFTDTAAAGEW